MTTLSTQRRVLAVEPVSRLIGFLEKRPSTVLIQIPLEDERGRKLDQPPTLSIEWPDGTLTFTFPGEQLLHGEISVYLRKKDGTPALQPLGQGVGKVVLSAQDRATLERWQDLDLVFHHDRLVMTASE